MSEDHQNDRLLSLEGAVRDMASQTGKLVVGQELLTLSVNKGFDELSKNQKTLAEEDKKLDERIKPFEAKAAVHASRIGVIKKLSIAGLVATAGVFGAVAGDKIVDFLGKLIGR